MITQRLLSLLIFVSLLACSNSGSTDSKKPETKDEKADSIAAAAPKADGSYAVLTDYSKTLPLDKIKLPAGFKIEVFAEVENARSLAISPAGIIYVGNRDGDKVYAIQDTDGDLKADKKWVVASGLKSPNGVAFK